MAGFPGGCKSVQEYCYFVFRRVTEYIDDHMSKKETASYLLDKFQIESPMTNIVWGSLERSFPASFGADNIQRDDASMAHTQNAQRDASASSSQASTTETENLKDMLSRLDQIKSIQDMLKVMTDGDGLGQRVENEPVRDDLWQRVLNTLGQIQRTTEQMLKLLTDGHGFGPRPAAAGSSKRQRRERAEERGGEGDEEEEENQHKNEEGGDGAAEKPQEKEECNDEEKEE